MQNKELSANKPEQVHSQEPRDEICFDVEQLIPHSLVANGHAHLIHTDLRTPHPVRLAQNRGEGLRRLRNFYVGALRSEVNR